MYFDCVDSEIDDAEEEMHEEVNTEDLSQQTIYHGHHLTVHASMVMILLYTICHNISGVQLSDLLTLNFSLNIWPLVFIALLGGYIWCVYAFCFVCDLSPCHFCSVLIIFSPFCSCMK